MSKPIGDPNLVVERDAVPGGGRLVMTEEAVQGWVEAYTNYAEKLRDLANQITREHRATSFGNLDSLRQLATGYDQLMYGRDDSLYQRLHEYADAATAFCDKLLHDWHAIQEEDALTSHSVTAMATE